MKNCFKCQTPVTYENLGFMKFTPDGRGEHYCEVCWKKINKRNHNTNAVLFVIITALQVSIFLYWCIKLTFFLPEHIDVESVVIGIGTGVIFQFLSEKQKEKYKPS